MLKYGCKLEPQLVKYKSKLNCMYQGLQISPQVKNWLFETPGIQVQRQHIFHSTNVIGIRTTCMSANQFEFSAIFRHQKGKIMWTSLFVYSIQPNTISMCAKLLLKGIWCANQRSLEGF